MEKKSLMFLVFTLIVLLSLFGVFNSAAAGEKVTLSLSHFFPASHFVHKIQVANWVKAVEEASGGDVKINVFPGGTLLKPRETYDGIVSGTADIGIVVFAYTRGRFPVMEGFELPGIHFGSCAATTAVAEAKVDLARAKEREADTSDAYKQALDRPWEDQEIRDSLYEDWQVSIVDRELAQLRLADAQLALEVHGYDLVARKKDVEYAAADLERVEKDPVDRAHVDKEVNLALRRAVEDAQAALTEVREDLEDAQLYAPWDALVLSLETSIGASVGSGTPVVTLLNLEDLYFATQNLSERHIAQLRRGQRAEITLRAYPDVILGGTVDVVLPQTERTSDTDAAFVAYIRPDESELDLLPEMTGRVEVITAK